jgi:CHAD domain-containing protein
VAKAQPITDVAADTPFGAFAARVVEVRAGEVQALPEGVHDRRVAIRRLRTALEVFGPALPKGARAVRRELKTAFAALGPRRDADVAVEALQALELAAADQPGLKSLLAELEAERAQVVVDEHAELTSQAAGRALALAASHDGGAPAAEVLRKVARKRVADVRGRLEALQDPRDADALHALRIAAKRLRYVLEAAAPALGDPAVKGAKAARELQTVLGDVHDCDVMLPRLAAHRRALRAADVAAIRAGQRPPNANRYRGVQAVDTHFRARREDLREQAAALHGPTAKALDVLEAAL